MHKASLIDTNFATTPAPFLFFLGAAVGGIGGGVSVVGGGGSFVQVEPAISAHTHIPHRFTLAVFVLHEPAHFRRWRIHGAILEDVQQEHTAVVEEMLDGFARETQVRVGQLRDAVHRGHAVDVGDDAGKSQIRGCGYGGEGDGGERHVPGIDGGRRRTGREELEVDCVCRVCSPHNSSWLVSLPLSFFIFRASEI